MQTLKTALLILIALSLSACASTYYDALEKVGIPKRDLMVTRVEKARDSQTEAQEQFKSALEEFASVVQLQNTDLKTAYERLDAEYEDSKDAADEVSSRINKVESVSNALFKEWQEELNLYENPNLRRSSEQKKQETERRYDELMGTMRRAEQSMQPVLKTFRDNVLFLKHNLNAQAIGALRSEFSGLESDIQRLISDMNRSIEDSNRFIQELDQQG